MQRLEAPFDSMKDKRILPYLWAAPASFLGLCCVSLAQLSGGKSRVVDGVLEVQGGLVARVLESATPLVGGAQAMTLGHVVVAQDQSALDRTRAHERVHVGQYERWGPFFIPAYLLSSALVALRGGDSYLDNPFEKEAYRKAKID